MNAVRPVSARTVRQAHEVPGVSEADLARLGLTGKAWGSTPQRRIDRVTSQHVEIEGVKLPRSAVKGQAVEGQWVKLRLDGAQVKAEVDLSTTLRGEARLADLFQALTAPR